MHSRQSAADPSDVVHRISWPHLTPLLARIDSMIAQQTPVVVTNEVDSEPETQPLLCCALCSFTTHSLANYRRRLTNAHGRRQTRTVTLDLQQHALGGLSTWRSFKTHVESHQCTPWQVQPTRTPPQIDQDIAQGLLTNSRLRVQDLAFLASTPSGCSFLRHVIQKRWDALAEDQLARDLLRARCGLCGAFISRMQDLSKHLKQHHRSSMEQVLPYANQLQDGLILDRHCRFCRAPFVTQHTCPILVQASIFVVNGAAASTDVGGPLAPLTCMQCDTVFPAADALHDHLLSTHRQRRYIFDAARDSVDAEGLACRHCGSLFVRHNGLQAHIEDGRCPNFDARRAPDQVPISPDWLLHLRNGAIMNYLEEPEHRSKWNFCCLTCNRTYDRTQNLHAHINLEHSGLWETSRPFLHLLLQTLFHQHGCICATPIKQTRSAHICPAFMQMAILLC